MSSSTLIMELGASVARHLTVRERSVTGFFPGRPRRAGARAAARPRTGRHRLHPGRRRRPEGPRADPVRQAVLPRMARPARPRTGTDRRFGRCLAHGGAGPARPDRGPRPAGACVRPRPELRGAAEPAGRGGGHRANRARGARRPAARGTRRRGAHDHHLPCPRSAGEHGIEARFRARHADQRGVAHAAREPPRAGAVRRGPPRLHAAAVRRLRAGTRAARAGQRRGRTARLGHHPARLHAGARHRGRAGRLLLGRGAGGLPPAAALPATDARRTTAAASSSIRTSTTT